MATWAVVSTVRGSKVLINHFIRHYAALGASEIFLYFDDPKVAKHGKIVGFPLVRATVCDDRYWADAPAGRPAAIEKRQFANHADALCRTGAEWMLHVDLDELIFAREPVDAVLSSLADNTFALVARPMEAVWQTSPYLNDIFTTRWFKRRRRQKDIRLASSFFGETLAQMTRGGFFAHHVGKSFIRVGVGIKKRSVHIPVPSDPAVNTVAETGFLDLLHFEGMRFKDWKEKNLKRISGEIQLAYVTDVKALQLQHVSSVWEKKGSAGLRRLYEEIHIFDGQRLDDALRMGFIEERKPIVTPNKFMDWLP